MVELVVGLIITAGCLYLVLEPLVRPAAILGPADAGLDWADIDESDSPKVLALTALSEIEFDLATGKLSQEDFEVLKDRYSNRALEAIRAEEKEEMESAGDEEDAVEAAIARVKRSVTGACPVCDSKLPAGAAFCSACGCSIFSGGLQARCWTCGSALEENARFCSDCGAPVKASVGAGN